MLAVEIRRMIVWLDSRFTDELSFADGETGSTVYLWHKPIAKWDDDTISLVDSDFVKQVVNMYETWRVWGGGE